MLAILHAVQWFIGWVQKRAAEKAARDLKKNNQRESRARQKVAQRIRNTVADHLRHRPERLYDDDGWRRD